MQKIELSQFSLLHMQLHASHRSRFFFLSLSRNEGQPGKLLFVFVVKLKLKIKSLLLCGELNPLAVTQQRSLNAMRVLYLHFNHCQKRTHTDARIFRWTQKRVYFNDTGSLRAYRSAGRW